MNKCFAYISACFAIFMLPSAAHATNADCADKLVTPAPGEALSTTALVSNNACLTYLSQAAKAAELKANISDSDRRASGEKAGQAAGKGGNSGTWFDSTAWPTPVPQTKEDDTLPEFDTVFIDRKSASATLVFADGSSMDVERGTPLPDGSSVYSISRVHGNVSVVIKTKAGDFKPLRSASRGFGAETPATASVQQFGSQAGAIPRQFSPPLLPTIPAPPGQR